MCFIVGLVVCLICLRLRMAVAGGVGVWFSLLGVVGYCCAWLDVGCGGFNGCCRCDFAARLCLWLVIVILLFWLFDGCFCG